MTMGLQRRNCILVTPAWPKGRSGYEHASNSLIRCLSESFGKVKVLVVAPHRLPTSTCENYRNVAFDFLETRLNSAKIRFLISTFSAQSTATLRYDFDKIYKRLTNLATCESVNETEEKPVLFLHDIPLGFLLVEFGDLIRELFSEVILRSDNVLADVFSQLGDKSFIHRVLLSLENMKLKLLEKNVLKSVSKCWAISEQDEARYKEIHNFNVHGVLGVSLDFKRYKCVPLGDPNIFIHLGSLDFRKSSGMNSFINESWPSIVANNPKAELRLGGKGSEHFNRPSQNVRGYGFVDNETEFLAQGMTFVNSQESGSGVKLKSLVALASGKVLLSTEEGVRGIGITSGINSIIANNAKDLGVAFLKASASGNELKAIAERGRALIQSGYSDEVLSDVFNHLMKSL